MITSKAVEFANLIKIVVLSIVGGSLFLFGFIGLIAVTTSSFQDDIVFSVVLALLFAAVGFWLLFCAVKNAKRINRMRRYAAYITLKKETSLDVIASEMSLPVNFVMKDIQILIDKKLFIHSYIDTVRHAIVWIRPEVPKPEVTKQAADIIGLKCSSCGAVNTVSRGSIAVCEYCDTPLK